MPRPACRLVTRAVKCLAEAACDAAAAPLGAVATARRVADFATPHAAAPSRELNARVQHGLCGTTVVIRFVRLHADSDAAPAGLDGARRRGAARPAAARLRAAAPGAGRRRRAAGAARSRRQLRRRASAAWARRCSWSRSSASSPAPGGAARTCCAERVGAGAGRRRLPRRARLGGARQQRAADSRRPGRRRRASSTTSRRAPRGRRCERRSSPPTCSSAPGRSPTALAEGARVIVAGCYDGAAPAIAAAVAAGSTGRGRSSTASPAPRPRPARPCGRIATPCDWLARGRRAAAALLRTRASSSTPTARSPSTSPTRCDDADAAACSQWLQAGTPSRTAHDHADVRCDASRADVSRDRARRSFASTGVTGAPSPTALAARHAVPDGLSSPKRWSNSLPGAAAVAAAANGRGVPHATSSTPTTSTRYVTVQELAPADGAAGGASWLHLACRSKRPQPCARVRRARRPLRRRQPATRPPPRRPPDRPRRLRRLAHPHAPRRRRRRRRHAPGEGMAVD